MARHRGPEVVLLEPEPMPVVRAVYRAARRDGQQPVARVSKCPLCKSGHAYPVAPGQTGELAVPSKCSPWRYVRLVIVEAAGSGK